MPTKQTPSPPERVRLTVSRSEAAKSIQGQIEEAESILNDSSRDFAAIKDRRDVWRDFTLEMLRRLFSDNSMSEEFMMSVVSHRISLAPRGSVDTRSLTESLEGGAKKLKSILRRLELIDAPADTLRETQSEPQHLADGWSLLHESIRQIAHGRFSSGNFADAAEAALKAVNVRVKKRFIAAGKPELDGAQLMFAAFNANNPIIVLDNLATETGRNRQEGYQQLFAGAMKGIRNPKAHDNITITARRSLHFLILASLLMDVLDDANVPS